MKEVFVFVEERCEYSSMFDIFFLDGADDYPFQTIYETGLDRRWQQFLTSIRGQQLTGGKLTFLLEGQYKWEKTISSLADQYDKVYVVFLNTSFHFHRPPYKLFLKHKKSYPNTYYILFYIDLVSRNISKYPNFLREQGVFDLIYSFDQNEAAKYGFVYHNTPYSQLPGLCSPSEPLHDLYFCANVKERKEDILAVLDRSQSSLVDVRMDLVLNEPMDCFDKYGDCVTTSMQKNTPYKEVLQRTLRSNCILEICLPGQNGMSIRAYEAVVYNKKLLTNNENIIFFPFYNARYMRYYRSVADIDWEWVKKRETVNYGYKDEFSPKHLLTDIRQRIDATC